MPHHPNQAPSSGKTVYHNPSKLAAAASRRGQSNKQQTPAPNPSSESAQQPGFGAYLVPFSIVFVVLYGCYRYLEASGALSGYSAWLAASIAYIFSFFNQPIQSENQLILNHGIPALEIVPDCNGLAFIILIAAAIAPFPRPIKYKILGLLVLISLLLLLNWSRILILAFLNFHYPTLFHFVHLYAFQPIMIFFTLISFMLWIRYSDPSS